MTAPWLREVAGAVEIALHVQPGAKRSEVAGVHGDALKLRLAAQPVEGKANDALLTFIADAFGVPQRNVSIVRGSRSRHKVVRIEAPVKRPDAAWAGALGR